MTTRVGRQIAAVWVLLAILLAVGAVLVSPGRAQAGGYVPAASYAKFADSQWPGSPCAGHVSYALSVDLPTEANGEAFPSECRVIVRPGLTTFQTCEFFVHEYGHLARQDSWHSSDPRDVMYPTMIDYGPCIEQFAWAVAQHKLKADRCAWVAFDPDVKIATLSCRRSKVHWRVTVQPDHVFADRVGTVTVNGHVR